MRLDFDASLCLTCSDHQIMDRSCVQAPTSENDGVHDQSPITREDNAVGDNELELPERECIAEVCYKCRSYLSVTV